MNAKQKGQDEMTSFTENRSSSTATKSIFDPVKKVTLIKLFSSKTALWKNVS